MNSHLYYFTVLRLTFPARTTAENIASGKGLACVVLTATPADTITGSDFLFNLTTRDGSKGTLAI